ncbi:hypothetical protein FLM9_564 [Candidatus Synechococcus spongiarum]|uniref:Uncharacterized protein n=1 Tax=Candidatus Synechococcus spongiarum TaxID=431041 RepID=A0A164ZQP4_9SYNE|nr:hypothetical protein FLM9_564 [Candidatus Synechococcus spongiarum]
MESGTRNPRPPSNSTRATSNSTAVSSPEPRSRGSIRPRPWRPVSNPPASSNTTAGMARSRDASRAMAPTATATAHSKANCSDAPNGGAMRAATMKRAGFLVHCGLGYGFCQ